MALSLTHSRELPIANARYSVPVSYRDTAGALTNPTSPDSEVSTDGGATFADCAEEVSPTGGHGYLTLSGAEMNNAALIVQCKGTGVLTEVFSVAPAFLPTLATGTAAAGGAATITLQAGSSAVDDYYNGCYIRTTGGTGGGGSGGANNQARRIVDYVGSTRVATVAVAWETQPSSDTTYDILVPDGWEQAAAARALLALPAVAPDSSGGLPTEDANGRISADATAISGDSGAADNLEAACDGGTYNVGGGGVVAASVTGAVGSVAGAVGSVTGAVGSVTGNVGGDVAGKVLGGGSGTMTAAGVRAVDGSGNAVASASAIAALNDLDSTEAQAAAAAALTAYDPPTNAELTAAVSPLALEATLTAIKGAGWSTETLAAIDALIDAIKAKTDLIPASPAAVGSEMDLVDAPNVTALAALTAAFLADGVGFTGTDVTVAQALQAAWSYGFGKRLRSGVTLTFHNPDGTTVRTFTLTVDGSGNVTAVTPV